MIMEPARTLITDDIVYYFADANVPQSIMHYIAAFDIADDWFRAANLIIISDWYRMHIFDVYLIS